MSRSRDHTQKDVRWAGWDKVVRRLSCTHMALPPHSLHVEHCLLCTSILPIVLAEMGRPEVPGGVADHQPDGEVHQELRRLELLLPR